MNKEALSAWGFDRHRPFNRSQRDVAVLKLLRQRAAAFPTGVYSNWATCQQLFALIESKIHAWEAPELVESSHQQRRQEIPRTATLSASFRMTADGGL